jgi:hypothetical protein
VGKGAAIADIMVIAMLARSGGLAEVGQGSRITRVA